jgi:hypothetical protein
MMMVMMIITAYVIPLAYYSQPVLSSNKVHETLTLLNLRPMLYIPMQKAVLLNTSRIVLGRTVTE